MPPRDFLELDRAGLNRQHVFLLADLPAGLRQHLPDTGYRQLILIGHAGRALWAAVQRQRPPGPDPIDAHTVQTLQHWLGDTRHHLLYPGPAPVGLQALGSLAGWHHPSPMMIGVDATWGSWHAYRAVVLADTDFPATPQAAPNAACPTCAARRCASACPADALSGPQFDLSRCAGERLRPGSACAEGCLARLACPVGSEHRYDAAQIRHSYRQSLAWLKAMK